MDPLARLAADRGEQRHAPGDMFTTPWHGNSRRSASTVRRGGDAHALEAAALLADRAQFRVPFR